MKSRKIMINGLLTLGKLGLKFLRWLLNEFPQYLKSKIFDVLFEWLESNPNQLVASVEWMHNFLVQVLPFSSVIPGSHTLLLAALLGASKLVIYVIEHWEEIAAWLTRTSQPVGAAMKQQTSNGWARHEEMLYRLRKHQFQRRQWAWSW